MCADLVHTSHIASSSHSKTETNRISDKAVDITVRDTRLRVIDQFEKRTIDALYIRNDDDDDDGVDGGGDKGVNSRESSCHNAVSVSKPKDAPILEEPRVTHVPIRLAVRVLHLSERSRSAEEGDRNAYCDKVSLGAVLHRNQSMSTRKVHRAKRQRILPPTGVSKNPWARVRELLPCIEGSVLRLRIVGGRVRNEPNERSSTKRSAFSVLRKRAR